MAVKRRKVKKSKRSTKRRLRKHFGGVLPAEFRFAQPEDRSTFSSMIQAAADKRAKNQPKFYHIPTRLQNWANKDTLDPSVMESLMGRYKYGDDVQKKRVLEELKTQFIIHDIHANPEDYMKEYMKGKHRRHDWVKTAARLGIGAASALGIGLAAYHWGLPGMIKGMFSASANTVASNATEEGIKSMSSDKAPEMVKKIAKNDAGNQGIGTTGQNEIGEVAEDLAKKTTSGSNSTSTSTPSTTGNTETEIDMTLGGTPPAGEDPLFARRTGTGANDAIMGKTIVDPKTGRKVFFVSDEEESGFIPTATRDSGAQLALVPGQNVRIEKPSERAWRKGPLNVGRPAGPETVPSEKIAKKIASYTDADLNNGAYFYRLGTPKKDAYFSGFRKTGPREVVSRYGAKGRKDPFNKGIWGSRTKVSDSHFKLIGSDGRYLNSPFYAIPKYGTTESGLTFVDDGYESIPLYRAAKKIKKGKRSNPIINIIRKNSTGVSFVDNGTQSLPLNLAYNKPKFMDNGFQSLPYLDNGYQSFPYFNTGMEVGNNMSKKARIAQQQAAFMLRNNTNTTGHGYRITRKGRHLIRKYRRHLKKKRTKH